MINKIEEFNVRLNKALSFRNMKPVELSEKTGISESTISQYRSGYAKPKEKKLAIIANALDVNPSWLMGLDVPMNLPTLNVDSSVDTQRIAEALNMFNAYELATPEIKAAIDSLLRTVKPVVNNMQNTIVPTVEKIQDQLHPVVNNMQKLAKEVPHLKVSQSAHELPHLKKDNE